jgi:Helicase associated domain
LNEIGFAWNAQETAWQRQMSDLQQFHCENGHCNVPIRAKKYPKLGLWVKEQRRHYTLMKQGKPSHMTIERYHQLNAINFCYDTHDSTWNQRLDELREFKKVHGNCIVPTNYKDSKLATWVHHQRRQFKKMKQGQRSHITEKRINALNEIGFLWSPRKIPCEEEDDSDDDSDVSSDESHFSEYRSAKRRAT